jgi:hypothetical protein
MTLTAFIAEMLGEKSRADDYTNPTTGNLLKVFRRLAMLAFF